MKKIYIKCMGILFFVFQAFFGFSQNTNTYTTAGTYIWTCPAGVTSVQVDAWGGGGAGGGINTTGVNRAGGGGGGGAYAGSASIAVTSGTTYTIVIGAGGAGSSGANGGTGANSTFGSTLVVAAGGTGGTAHTAAASTAMAGGAGGTTASSTGTTVFSGGGGGTSATTPNSGAGGGSAGNAANGGDASGNTAGTAGSAGGGVGAAGLTSGNAAGNAASAVGGGGSGARAASTSTTARAGGSGAAGKVVLTYTGYCSPNSTSSSSYFDAFSTTGGSTNISNSATGFSPGGLANFTAQTLTQLQGGVINFTGTLAGTTVGVNIYVDFNDNNTFETTEKVYNSGSYISTLSGSFTLPVSAPAGSHRMRIIMDYNTTDPAACSFNSGRGEMEDYTLVVQALPDCGGTPSGGTVTQSVYRLCTGATATLTVSGQTSGASGLTYQWEQSADGVSGWTAATGGSGATTLSYTTPAYAGTPIYYRLTITCTPSSQSSSSTAAQITNPAASIQASAFTASSLTATGATLGWTNGNGNNRSVFINTTNSFTDPVSPNTPGTAVTAFTNTGQQLIYDGTGTSVSVTGLAGGTTYYVRIYESQKCTGPAAWYYNTVTATGNPGSFSIATPPANDECATAITITTQPYVAPGTCPGAVSGTTLGATSSSITAPPSSAWITSQDDDVWYQFTATSAAQIFRFCNVTYPYGSAQPMGMSIHSNCSASATELYGNTITITGGTGEAAISGFTVGTVYKLRILTSGTTSRANFDFSILDAPNMSLVSSTVTQAVTTSVVAGSVNNQVIGLEAVVTGASNPLTVTTINFNTLTTVPTDVTSAKVYYTGTSSTFATTTLYGTAVANPNGSFTVTGSQTLSGTITGNATNYFWLVYDLSCGAAPGNSIDASGTDFTANAVNYIPTVTSPAGTRTITAYVSPVPATSQPLTSSISNGTVNAQVLQVSVAAGVCLNSITQLNFTNASTNAADISKARVYYTTTSTFATTTQFGSDVVSPGAIFSVSGTLTPPLTGTLYFWLVYDIDCAAPSTAGNVADASFTGINTSLGTLTAATANPTGSRTIVTAVPATSQPLTTSVSSGAVNVQVLQVSIAASACLNSITQFNFTNASTNVADISKARLYYTTTSTFAATTQFGSDVTAPGATFSITGTLTPPTTGTLYFWLVYDVDCAAPSTAGNVADASFTGMVTNLGTLTATTANPTGTRTITAPAAGDNIGSAPSIVLGSAGGNAYVISGKSLEAGEPSPPTNIQPSSTNGSGTSNYSWGSAAGGTQWFKLTVPTSGYGSSGNLLIRATTTASPADAQLALWKFPNLVAGSGCGTAPNFTGGVLLAANDDAIVSGTGYTGSSTLNSVIRVRLTPGSTYYIQLDGYTTSTPSGDLIVEDLADAAGKNVSNNGFGDMHNPATTEMLYASYEVIGDDGWTYYYNNNGTSTNIADDKVILGLNWSSSSTYLWNGSNGTATNDMMNHVRRDATSSTAPSSTAPASATSTDAFVVWSGRLAASATSGDLKPTAPYVQAGASHWWMMNKFWNVFPNVQPTTSVGVRFFYSDADYAALNSTITTGGGTALTSHSDMEFLKFTKSATTHYTNAQVDPASGHSVILKPTVSKLTWTNTDAVQTGINQAQFNINSFSGGGGGSTGQAALVLPIGIEYFTGRKQAAVNVLDWKVNSSSASTLTLERSTDRVNYKTINTQTASVDRMLTPFTYTDAAPAAGVNYYRLKITNADGESKYSNVVALINKDKGFELISVVPNPVQHSTVLSLSSVKAGKIELSVSDVTGKVVMKQSVSVIAGNNPITLNFATLSAGTYQITAINADGDSKSTRFVKF
jgi:hypothetical protein